VGFALTSNDRSIVAGVGQALVRMSGLHGPVETLATVRGEPPANRVNDAAFDPAGRLLAGTMSSTRAPGTAALYRLGPSGALERLLPATLSNGFDWNRDATLLYYIDSITQQVDAIAYDIDTGRLGARRRFIGVDPRDGLPDGLTVDAEGGLWVALFGGGCIRRYEPHGGLDAVVQLPVTNPTSPAFGGAGLATLFVTSARHRLTAGQRRREPLAGAVPALRPGVTGRPPSRPGWSWAG
jgi:sugar lactone lactonase YvrE